MAQALPSDSGMTRSVLAELLTVLTARMGVDVDPADLERAADSSLPGSSGVRRLDGAFAAVGLRVRWLVAPVADAVALARPDLPVVGRSEHGTWWVLDGRAPGLVHAMPVADPRGPRWMTSAALAARMGGGARRWGLIEPVLPAAPLASPDRPRSPVQRLKSLLWIERRDVAVVMVYGAVAGLLALATPLAIQVLINWLAFGALLQPIVVLGGALLVCLGLASLLQVLQRVGVETIERRVFVRTVADLAARLSRVRAEALDGVWGPELANRFFDVLTLQKAASTLLLDGFTAFLQVVVAVTLLGLYHPWLLVFDLFLLAGMALVIVPLGRGAQATAIRESKSKYAVAAWIEEVARHPLVLRQDGSRLADDRADQLAREWLGTRRGHFRIFLRQFIGVQALQVLMSTVLLVTSGALVLDGQLTIGQLVAAEFIVTTALLGFAKFADKLDTFYDLLAAVDKLGALLDLPPERLAGLPAAAASAVHVRLEGAGIRHPSGGALHDLDLELVPGSRTAVLGAPGVGKTTLGSLVAGFRGATAGAVRRDGIDVRALRPDARYQGVVRIAPQDLLAGSVRDNVTLGRPGLSDEAVWQALERVGLRARVEALLVALDTLVDPAGAPLSDGEQRALLVARAVVSRPRLVVVDGVLDGLPAPLRATLHRALAGPDAPWTLLLLTGDPAVSDLGGRVLTLDPGGLREGPSLA